jgi:CheY-like chemotaxis protein
VHLDASFAAVNLEAVEGPYVCIRVQDTGEGIPADIIDRIFDPFSPPRPWQRHGLGTSHQPGHRQEPRRVHSHHQQTGRGHPRPRLYPGPPGIRRCARSLSPVDLPNGGGETILVVDDEAPIRQIACHALENFGYRTLFAANGAEALALYLEHQSEIAIVFTDLMMPVMDGPEMIGRIREINPAARIIATSGIVPNLDSTHSAMDSIRHFLPKPYTAETLLKCIRRTLGNDESPA